MNPVGRYRRAKGWTQADLARQMGVSTNTIQAWEKGANPRPRQLPKLAEAFGVDSLALFGELEAWRSEQDSAAKSGAA
jgi:transcriptional regulator with XRE-family HTH domain